MPDWKVLVGDRIGSLDLPPAARDEVIAELATHLEDIYEEQLAAGVAESQALDYALQQATGWGPLSRNIERAKRKEEIMNSRTKQLWLPGLVSLAGSMGWMMVLQITSTKLQMPWRHAGVAFLPYVVWVMTLPLIGAASGYLSVRAGSTRPARIVAVVFPSIVMSVLWLGLLAVILARKSPQPFQTLNFSFGFLLWVVLPAAALLLGTVRSLRAQKGSELQS
jgi:hypothetical protein